MRHAIFAGDGEIRLARSADPVAGEGEAILQVGACALCGSDLRPWRRGWPVTPGHEIVGVVDKQGHALHGRRALVYIPVWCGRCAACADGDAHLCENATDLMGWQRPGGYAERLAVPLQCRCPTISRPSWRRCCGTRSAPPPTACVWPAGSRGRGRPW
jgi:L-iditol 2-dehydrogenase